MSSFPFRTSVHLSQDEAYQLMREMLTGGMETPRIAQVLQFLHRKGETVAELVGFASALREMARPVPLHQLEEPILDTCGTGGDGTRTLNISTATAFVVAGAGVRVAKHGNRRISSQCGSADVLEVLGIPIDASAEQVGACVAEVGIGFLYAPLLHPAIKQVQEARLQLKTRTVFNLLGPLTNPVRARVQLIGAYSVRAAELLAHAAARLGVERAYVVHGSDGLDEITLSGPTTVFQVDGGRVQKGQWQPADFGLPHARVEELSGGDPETNAALIRRLLGGEQGPRRDVVVANAAAALLLAQRTPDLKSAVALAASTIDEGLAMRKLDQLVAFLAPVAQDQ